jgi:hypothetical protein
VNESNILRRKLWSTLGCATILALLHSLMIMPDAHAQQARWSAEYFSNPTLNGPPVTTRSESAIDFNWGTGSPAAGVPADGFSARWTRNEWFEAGTFRFWSRSDDGFRLWVGDIMVFDNWFDQQGGWKTRDIYLNPGPYQVRAEYYENVGGALVTLNWERVGGGPGWQGEYYANQNLSGSPSLRRTDSTINFDWKDGAPAPGLPADHFSVRWKQTLNFSAGTYRFFTSTDDGVRVWVDNRLVVDAWFNQALPNTRSGDSTLNAGAHEVRVEYYEDTKQAAVRAWWERVAPYPTPDVPTIAGWRGEYFGNRDLAGGPALVREDPAIEFDWGTGSPASWIPSDSFSVRWARQLSFSPGYYRLSVLSDDGVRVWVDNALVIDRWYPMAAELHYVDGVYLSGAHQLRVEYFEQTGYASIRFWFSPGTGPGQPVPTPQPPAPGAALVDNTSPGFVRGGTATGWRTVAGGYGGSMVWTKNNDYARKNYNWARWYLDLAPGRYEVLVFIPDQYATTTNARYWVRHADGYTLTRVDQSTRHAQWVSLGIYRFTGDDSEYISLSDITYERYLSTLIAFDAAKWEPR